MNGQDTRGQVLPFPTGGRRVAEAEMLPPDRALVPVDAGEQPLAAAIRRDASFVAQLIAARAQVPQSRERRRAEPDVAVHAYQATLAGKPAAAGRHFSTTN